MNTAMHASQQHSMYFPIAMNRPAPYSAIEYAMRNMTPIGEVSMITARILKTISETLFTKAAAFFPFSPSAIIMTESTTERSMAASMLLDEKISSRL